MKEKETWDLVCDPNYIDLGHSGYVYRITGGGCPKDLVDLTEADSIYVNCNCGSNIFVFTSKGNQTKGPNIEDSPAWSSHYYKGEVIKIKSICGSRVDYFFKD